jgi:DNA-binding NarL/FixJ family response regulator
VILDYKMPKINGMEVAKEILAINPHQRIIFSSICKRNFDRYYTTAKSNSITASKAGWTRCVNRCY